MTSDASARDGLGLGKMGRINISSLLNQTEERFSDINLDTIREDGDNPRRQFDPQSLEELAETIRARGVITPISVRQDPEHPSGYVINHGHRRFRAAKLAGLTKIPAVIDSTFRDEDRIIENIQRDNLDMLDVAAFIGRKLQEGMKKKDIATLIGKSNAYVSNHVQLLELPQQTAQAVKKKLTEDLTAINELAKAEKFYPEEVRKFLTNRGEMTRREVLDFRAGLENRREVRQRKDLLQDPPLATAKMEDVSGIGLAWARTAGATLKARVVVEYKGWLAVLMLDRKARDKHHAWLHFENPEIGDEEALVEELEIRAVMTE